MFSLLNDALGRLRCWVAYALLVVAAIYMLAVGLVFFIPLLVLWVLARTFHPAWPSVLHSGSKVLNNTAGGETGGENGQP